MPRTKPLPAPVAEELRDCVHKRGNESLGGNLRETTSLDSWGAVDVEELELAHTQAA